MEIKYIIAGFFIILITYALARGKRIPHENQATETDIDDAIKSGDKIRAIKYYRRIHGVGLAEAKSAVDEMCRDQ